MKSTNSYWLIGIISFLLLGLFVNQIIFVHSAAVDQEVSFKDKANAALESIVNAMSQNYQVCSSVSNCFSSKNSPTCSRAFKSKKEWTTVDSIIQSKLALADIDLNYKFDFCTSNLSDSHELNIKNSYSKTLDQAIPKSGVLMYLEFPSKSKYILRQMGPVFISSVLLILLISLVFIFVLRSYYKEKRITERTRIFFNNMTHEFKTPLTNIAFANNLLTRRAETITPTVVKKYTDIIRSENSKIIESTEDILEMAKQEYNLDDVTLENTDAHDVLRDLPNSFTSTRQNHDLSISLHLDASDSSVLGKPSFLCNAFTNIIDNSIKYCSIAPKISIYTINKAGHLIISITDNGVGIDKKDLSKIFDRFYRVPTGDRHDVKGYGLGLSYVKRVIDRMKGDISVTSSPGNGSTFTIKLPLTSA